MGQKQTKDMAVCFVVFNPAQTKRILMNYLYTKNHLDIQGIPNFTLELVYEGRKPEIHSAFHVSSNSFMFHKENLYKVLESKIPRRYTKLAFLDCDVLFPDTEWYFKVSKLLDTHDVVQPFEDAVWMDLTYTKKMLRRKSVLFLQTPLWDFQYHPGFAWCMRRDWFKRVGFFEYAVSGSGDTLSVSAWMNKTFPRNFQSLPKALVGEYARYRKLPVPRITYLKGVVIYHLYHGARANRKYAERHKMLEVPEDITRLVKKNKQGVFEWNNPDRWNPLFLDYFVSRNDDDLSEEPAKTDSHRRS